ncbi:ABC-type polar amino acid transport system ATPase subunit [Bradyrhizobium diazoefficiens]
MRNLREKKMAREIAANETGRSAAIVTVENVVKRFGGFTALSDVNLSVRAGEKIVLCGPSGSGKSTLIRCINHIEKHDGGRIVVDGIELSDRMSDINDVRREVGMVFQSFNLFPHLSVVENCMLGPDQGARSVARGGA